MALFSGASLADSIENEFTVQRFNPAPGPRNFFTTRGARTDGEMAFSGGLFINYGSQPFVVESCESLTNCDEPNALFREDVGGVENIVTGDVLASITPFPRLQLGLRVPVTWVDGDGITADGS
ncbi:MAG TPA: hypothetical protein VK524_21840, partial [Polyangiaceae bacterium]|nr:hypothetical protein [Polyangiaceae bacterium]